MSFIYHAVPKNLSGKVLYPLNQLKTYFPGVYTIHAQKYMGREHLMQRQVFPLNCLWNDVLHCFPVHPAQIRYGFIHAGFDWHPRLWFIIHPTSVGISKENTVIFLRTLLKVPEQLDDFNFSSTKFVSFSEEQLSRIVKLPTATLEYWKFAKAAGEAPFLFNFVPHILYRGTIEIQDLDLIHC
ncbi:hypothetical protein HC928_13625 [bacterium]|nr:hypothetical protein [bacterium]